jgi:hypothetical protein
VADETPENPPLPTAQGELPRLYKLDPLRFQGMCRDLLQVEPGITTAEVYGVPGQTQRGIDVLALHRGDDGTSVGQCKRVVPRSLTPSLIADASAEFLEHLNYWRERRVRKFILFVAPDASRTKIQEEVQRQRDHFRTLGIEYELWGEAIISNKLRPHPGITRTYLGELWTQILCGTGVSGFPRESVLIDRVLHAQLETLAKHVSTAAEAEVEALRFAWREGRPSAAASGLLALREPSRWQAFSLELRATIIRFQSQLALGADDTGLAEQLAAEAIALDPSSSVRLTCVW